MNKTIYNAIAIGVLAIIVISLTLKLTGLVPDRVGDLIMVFSSFVIAIIIYFVIRKQKREEEKKS
ncbi:MAG: hypothetical protein D6732_27460 [Methanobacteriota archaeon]|nr:MAG: hypothetical protein D6732_27460 [Euryarchaeota archaeon]